MTSIILNNKETLFELYDDCIISDFIREGRPWEPHLHEVFSKYITKDFIVLEAGCHIGTHSMVISDLCKTLYCFEPFPSSNQILNKNIQLNNRDNVILSNNALGESIYKTEFSWSFGHNPGASGLKNNPMGSPGGHMEDKIEVDVVTIDSLNLSGLDFMKIDVEGFEINVINGGLKTIEKFRPIITLECWSNHNGGTSIEHTQETFKVLIDMGYSLEQIHSSDYIFLP